MYYDGDGVEQNYSEAAKWWQRAAEQGHAGAQNNLAMMYDDGKGVRKNKSEAVKYYCKAAEQGDKYARHNLALVCYENVEQKCSEAIRCFRLKARQDYSKEVFIQIGAKYLIF